MSRHATDMGIFGGNQEGLEPPAVHADGEHSPTNQHVRGFDI